MTIQQLEYFLSAARTLNFTKTAEHFFISQSAVTQQIKNLEAELQVTLFSRSNRKLQLTNAGKLLTSEAQAIISKTRSAIDKVQAVQNGKSGILNIGYLKCIEMSRFPRSVQNFHNKYPGVHMNLKRDNAIHLHDDLLRGQYDIIFNIEHDLLRYPDYGCRMLNKSRFLVVLPPGHPLTREQEIQQEDLKYETLIIHDFHRDIPGSLELIPRKYLNQEILSNATRTSDDVETILIMVASGMGIAILPDFDLYYPQINLNLIYIPLNTNGYMQVLNVYYAKEYTNPLIPLFLEEV